MRKTFKLVILLALLTGLMALTAKQQDIDMLRDDDEDLSGSSVQGGSGSGTEEVQSGQTGGNLSYGGGQLSSGSSQEETPSGSGQVESGQQGANPSESGEASGPSSYNLEQGVDSSSASQSGQAVAPSNEDQVDDGETDGESLEDEIQQEIENEDAVISPSGNLEKVHLSLEGALNFDVNSLTNPSCASEDFFEWYMHEVSQWLEIVRNPDGFERDVLTLSDVRSLIEQAKSRISEVDALPIQSLIQLKIKALNKIETMQFVTLEMNESLETIKELVELLNKAKDGSTALKLCDLILEDLDSLQLIFQSALERRAEFSVLEDQLEGVVGSIEVSAQGCGYTQITAPESDEAAPQEESEQETVEDADGAAEQEQEEAEVAALLNTQTDEISNGVLIAEEIDSVVNLAEQKKKSSQEKVDSDKTTTTIENDMIDDNSAMTEEQMKQLQQENKKLIDTLTQQALEEENTISAQYGAAQNQLTTDASLLEKKKKVEKNQDLLEPAKNDFDDLGSGYPGSQNADQYMKEELKKDNDIVEQQITDAQKDEEGITIVSKTVIGFLEKKQKQAQKKEDQAKTEEVEEVNTVLTQDQLDAQVAELTQKALEEEKGNIIPEQVPLGLIQTKIESKEEGSEMSNEDNLVPVESADKLSDPELFDTYGDGNSSENQQDSQSSDFFVAPQEQQQEQQENANFSSKINIEETYGSGVEENNSQQQDNTAEPLTQTQSVDDNMVDSDDAIITQNDDGLGNAGNVENTWESDPTVVFSEVQQQQQEISQTTVTFEEKDLNNQNPVNIEEQIQPEEVVFAQVIKATPLVLLSEFNEYENDNENVDENDDSFDNSEQINNNEGDMSVADDTYGETADYAINVDENGNGESHDANEDTYGSLYSSEDSQNDLENGSVSSQISQGVDDQEGENNSEIMFIQEVEGGEKKNIQDTVDDLKIISQNDDGLNEKGGDLNNNFGDYLDSPSIGDGIDDQMVSGDGSIGDGLLTTTQNTEDLKSSQDSESVDEKAGLIENSDQCERLDDDSTNNMTMNDEAALPVDDQAVQPVDNLDENKATNEVLVDINENEQISDENSNTAILNGQSLIAISMENLYDNSKDSNLKNIDVQSGQDQNLLASGINFQVVPEAEQKQIDAEKSEHHHEKKHLQSNSNSKQHHGQQSKKHEQSQQSAATNLLEEEKSTLQNSDEETISQDDHELLANQINFQVIPEAEQKEIDEQAKAIKQSKAKDSHHHQKHHKQLRRAHQQEDY